MIISIIAFIFIGCVIQYTVWSRQRQRQIRAGKAITVIVVISHDAAVEDKVSGAIAAKVALTLHHMVCSLL